MGKPYDDFIKGLKDLAGLVGSLINPLTGKISPANIGNVLGKKLSDKVTGNKPNTTSEADEQTAVRNEKSIKKMQDELKRINKKILLLPRKNVNLKIENP